MFFDWEEEIIEGKAHIIIPKRSLYLRPDKKYEPAWSMVFYNPLMRISRDLTVLSTRVFFHDREFFFIDVLAGTGIRGIRLVLESNGYGIVNDIDPIAYYYMRRNIIRNNISDSLLPYMCESNSLLNNYTFSGIPIDYIDVDPYGSPIPFIDSVVKPLSKKAFLGVTATDSAPLVCSHSHKTLRRYNVLCTKTDFEKELGLRILIYNIVFRGASHDVFLKPVLSYSHQYYYRIFFITERSGNKSYGIIKECRGYIWYCDSTLERGYLKKIDEYRDIKCLDNSYPKLIGPLWICDLGDISFVQELINEAVKNDIAVEQDTLKLLEKLRKEYVINQLYVRYDKLFGLIKKNQPPINEFIKTLRQHGYHAERTHFDPRGVKINASLKEIIQFIKRIY